jgi:hypothetical protein
VCHLRQPNRNASSLSCEVIADNENSQRRGVRNVRTFRRIGDKIWNVQVRQSNFKFPTEFHEFCAVGVETPKAILRMVKNRNGTEELRGGQITPQHFILSRVLQTEGSREDVNRNRLCMGSLLLGRA